MLKEHSHITVSETNYKKPVINGRPLFSCRNNGPERSGHQENLPNGLMTTRPWAIITAALGFNWTLSIYVCYLGLHSIDSRCIRSEKSKGKVLIDRPKSNWEKQFWLRPHTDTQTHRLGGGINCIFYNTDFFLTLCFGEHFCWLKNLFRFKEILKTTSTSNPSTQCMVNTYQVCKHLILFKLYMQWLICWENKFSTFSIWFIC